MLLVSACGMQQPVTSTPAPLLPYEEPSVSGDSGAEGTISGVVRHEATRAPLGSAIVVLQSQSLPSSMELVTDDYGRYRFDGLVPGTYTVQVLVGFANVARVFTLEEGARFSVNVHLDPEHERFGCRLLGRDLDDDTSMFSITDETEARLLGLPSTVRKL